MFDADFPQGIAQQVLAEWTPSIELVPWELVIPTTDRVSDEDFIVNAWQRGYDGMVTCNHRMLDVPETLAIIRQTAMTVVACHGRTNITQAATGLLLVNLENIARQFRPEIPQVWELREPMRGPEPFNRRVAQLEKNCKCRVADFERTSADLNRELFDLSVIAPAGLGGAASNL